MSGGNDKKPKKVLLITGISACVLGFFCGFICPWIIQTSDLVFSNFFLIPICMVVGFLLMSAGMIMSAYGANKTRRPSASNNHDRHFEGITRAGSSERQRPFAGENENIQQDLIICENCGEANPPSKAFCSNCGDML